MSQPISVQDKMFWEAPFKDDHAEFSIPDYTTNDLEARMYTIE